MKRSLNEYRITDKTLVSIADIERNLAQINQNEVAQRTSARLAHEILFDDLLALSNALNLNLSLGEIKKITIGKEPESTQAQLLLNVKQVFDFVKNNYREMEITFNFHLVQHVVKLLQTDVLEVWDIGKIRSGEEPGELRFELENQLYDNVNTTSVLAETVIWIEDEEDIHPIIKACIFLYLFNKTSPFSGLNFLSSMILFRIILEKYGYGYDFKIPLFKVFTQKSASLINQLNESLIDNENGLTEFITLFSALLSQTIADYKREHIELDYFDIKAATNQLDLNDRQIKLLKLLQQKVNIKRREYIKVFKVSAMTAYRDLNFLTEKKLIVVSGQGKSTTYTLAIKA